MAVYAPRSRSRHKPGRRAKQRSPGIGDRGMPHAAPEPTSTRVDPAEPVGSPRSNQPEQPTAPPNPRTEDTA